LAGLGVRFVSAEDSLNRERVSGAFVSARKISFPETEIEVRRDWVRIWILTDGKAKHLVLH
jgi:hypothetical protein